MSSDKVTFIKETILSVLPDDSLVYVLDPNNDGEHFEALIISSSFDGLSLVKQHQLIMNALKSEFDSNTVHALALKTFTPEKWELKKDQFPLTH